MKIVFYTISMKSGGAERVIANLANEFIKEHDVKIFTLINTNIDYELNEKVKIICSSNNDKNNFFNKIIGMINLYKNTKSENPDTIIAFCPTMCFISGFFKIISKKYKKIKLIMSERNDPSNKYKNFILKKMADFFYSKADIIVFQNDGAKTSFSKKVQEKGIIIPNPINNKFIIKEKQIKKENSIVSVGRLELQKNHYLLIKACSDVFRLYPKWSLKIYGDGSLKEDLNSLIKELNMEKNIFLMGRKENLEDLIPISKIFVLSSNYEGMPNALMEAMACGLACISTDCPCGGPREIIDNGKNGYLIPVNNQQELFNKIRYLIENEEKLKKVSNESKKIINRYDNGIIIKKWYDLINN